MANRTPEQPLNLGDAFLLDSLPIHTLNTISRLRNPTLYIFPNDRQTVISLAETIATKNLLKLLEIPFYEVERYNADSMSPNLLLPLLIQEAQIAGGYEKIVGIINSMFPHLSADPDTKANCDLIVTVLRPSLEYFQFLTADTVTQGSDILAINLPFPVSYIVPFQQHLKLRISYYGISERKVLQELDSCLSALDTFTGKGIYPSSDKHLIFSCLLFGYLYAIKVGFVEEGKVKYLLQRYEKLNLFYEKMEEELK